MTQEEILKEIKRFSIAERLALLEAISKDASEYFTDVMLDFLLKREPFFAAAREMVELIAQGAFDAYISAVTPLNVFYIARQEISGDAIRRAIAKLLSLTRVGPIEDAMLAQTLVSPIKDYEDAVQHACATAAGLDAIVTRNLEDLQERDAAGFFGDGFSRRFEIATNINFDALSANVY